MKQETLPPSGTGSPPRQPGSAWQQFRNRAGVIMPQQGSEFGRLVALVASVILLMVIFEITSHGKEFNTSNVVDIFDSGSVLGIVAVGEVIVMIAGGLDISVGSNAGLVTAVAAVVMADTHQNVLAGIVVSLAVGAAAGAVNGIMVAYVGVNSVIATLATYSAFLGIALLATNGTQVGVPSAFFDSLGTGKAGPIPFLVIVFVVLAVAGILFMRYTVPGRKIYAVGSSQRAARLAGIPVDRYMLGVFVLSGLMAGVAGILLVAQTGTALPSEGTVGLELTAITAVLLGGTGLAGGTGTVLGAALAVLVLETLDNGLLLNGVPSFWQEVATGVLLVIAVTFQNYQFLRERLSAMRIPGRTGRGSAAGAARRAERPA